MGPWSPCWAHGGGPGTGATTVLTVGGTPDEREDPAMARQETSRLPLGLGLVACCTGGVVVLLALYLGFYFEATPNALARSAKGHRIAVPAVVALVAGIVAVLRWQRRWALVVGGVAAAAAVVAVALAVLLPGGEY